MVLISRNNWHLVFWQNVSKDYKNPFVAILLLLSSKKESVHKGFINN